MLGLLTGALTSMLPDMFKGIGAMYGDWQERKRLDIVWAHRKDMAADQGVVDVGLANINAAATQSAESASILKAAYKHDTAQDSSMVAMLDAIADRCSKRVAGFVACLFALVLVLKGAMRPLVGIGAAVIWGVAEITNNALSVTGEETVAAVVMFLFTDRAKQYVQGRMAANRAPTLPGVATPPTPTPAKASDPSGGLSDDEGAA